jgi:hypothetical protein
MKIVTKGDVPMISNVKADKMGVDIDFSTFLSSSSSSEQYRIRFLNFGRYGSRERDFQKTDIKGG